MSNVIKLLPDSVANQIAAGEVIQRPASVIKELVENAVDSGATRIDIVARDAGKTLIQVVDNGCGMSDTDARLAFERHATSKIRQADDLFELTTMGFRGEALPSIVAVAQVELDTMRAGDSNGTHLVIEGSKFVEQTPAACKPGTNLKVKNLFFNFPARRKFLKRDTVELSHIMHEFERLALVNPRIEFTLTHNDITLHQLLPASLKGRIAALFGKALERQLIPVETETPIVRISGFVSLPENARRRNPLQYLFVNGRNMQHPYFKRAITSCYEELIDPDLQPNYFLSFEVDPHTIDVNIHPTKSEIKFENEAPIWQILQAAVREALGRFNAAPAIDFNRDDAPDIPAFDPTLIPAPQFENVTDYNPFEAQDTRPSATGLKSGDTPRPSSFNTGDTAQWRERASAITGDWQKLYDNFQTDRASESTVETRSDDSAAPVLQIENRYIVTPSPDGLLVVERYRAHLTVLFHRFAQQLTATDTLEIPAQQLLFAPAIQLTPAQEAVLRSILPDMTRAGFAAEPDEVTPGVWRVTALPTVLKDENAADLLTMLLEAVEHDTAEGAELLRHTVRRTVALTLARAAAVRPGTPLPEAQARQLVADLLALPEPARTPEGHVTFTRLPLATITAGF